MAATFGLSACGSSSSSSSGSSDSSAAASTDSTSDAYATSDASASTDPAADKYTITDEVADTSNEYMYQITGTLTNNTDKEQSYVGITYTLYDADGNQIGNAYANTNNLKAGGTWKFTATGTAAPSEVARFDRSDVTIY